MRFSVFLIFLFCAISGAAVEFYEEKKVCSIEVIVEAPGREIYYDPAPVLSRLKTKEGGRFSQNTFDNDLKGLAEDYDRVEPSIEVKNGQIAICIRLIPRPVIHSISWTGNNHFDTSKLQKELGLEPNTVFHRQEFNQSFKKVKELYVKESYFESVLTYQIVPIEGTNQVDIVIHIQEGRPGVVENITFNGFTPEEKSDLTNTIYLQKYNFFTSWLTGSGYLKDELLEQDKMTILNYLHNKGYADAKLDIQLIEDPQTGRLIVEITTHRGPLFHIGRVCIEGNTLFSNEEIMKTSLVHEGDIYSSDKVRDTAQTIKDLYGQKGYIDASVQFETQLSENEPIFNVEYDISEGQQYKIGLIHIFGNTSTKNNVILRESLLVPGESFDARKLKATQMRLEAIGYFKCVNVYAVRTADDASLGPNYRDVYIEVEEKLTGSINLFMGFSSLENIYGGIELTEHNFRAAGIPGAFAGHPSGMRGGGEYVHLRATVGKKEDSYVISWMNPYVNDSLWRLGIELSKTFSELQAHQKIRTYGGSVFANYPFWTYWTYGMRQRIRHTSNMVTHKVSDAISENEKDQLDQHGLISAFSVNLNYDSTDSAVKPHRGWRSYLEGEFAGIGGKYTFAKTSYVNSIYFPIWAKGTLKLRGDFRYIFPFWKTPHQINIPLSERLFLGGENTVRGYQNYSIGKFIGNTDSPLGGISSTLLSLEYNQSIFKILDLFAFFDAGSISTHRLMVKNFKASIGGGARIDIGHQLPIMIGYGYPFNANKNQKQKFFFSMAGQF